MKKKYVLISLCLGFVYFSNLTSVQAVWIWNPKSGEWTNPKYEVKGTPKDQFDHAESYEKEEKWLNAAKSYQKLVSSYPRSKIAPKALLKEAESFEKAGYYYEAFEAYQSLITRYPSYRKIEHSVEDQYRIGNLFLSGKKRKMKVIKIAILSGYNQAIEVFQKVRDNLPFGELADDAQFRIGLSHAKLKQLTKAIDVYRELIRRFPESDLRDDAKFRIGLAYQKLSKGSEYDQVAADNAIDAFREFLIEFPESTRTAEVKKNIEGLQDRKATGIFNTASYYDKVKEYQAALIYYRLVIERFPESSLAGQAKIRIEKLNQKINPKMEKV